MKPISIPTVFEPIGTREKTVLFLGYDRDHTTLIDALLVANCEVHHTEDEIPDTQYDLVISFGYRHLIRQSKIESLGCPIINLHISYLPYNRGAHPNFWSFFDGTPAGVTIHLIDEGIDTGPILFQKRVVFTANEITFAQTYDRLFKEIEALFIGRLPAIIAGNWTEQEQVGVGTQHNLCDLPVEFAGWNSVIVDEIKRLRQITGNHNA
ncbi:formyltransferase family protein [Ruegeria sp. ANG-R]|uniref:formyltransferase family protein n=1 Tax=Ruegeria sp. ANG-R TaxID=1577903 RepID=UPI00068D251A|nr:formyltransferase family protein [Ruegeria sp. ANG-R]